MSGREVEDLAKSKQAVPDIRDEMLRSVKDNIVAASVVADDHGIIGGVASVEEEAARLDLTVEWMLEEGSRVEPGDEIVRFRGAVKQVLAAEDAFIGLLAKPSGIATAARTFVEAAGERPRIVSGAWKKMPPSAKAMVRRAVVAGGASFRVSPNAFVYLDKNYIRVLGGIKNSLEAVAGLEEYEKVVQLKGRYGAIAEEAFDAVENGAVILHVDTGDPEDIKIVSEALMGCGKRDRVSIAFGGGVVLEDVAVLKGFDVDILDVGRKIVDAPLLDMKMEVRVPDSEASEAARS